MSSRGAMAPSPSARSSTRVAIPTRARLRHRSRGEVVAGRRGDGGRLGALPAHVAEDDGPAPLARLEKVVEVAAHLVALAGGAKARCDVEPRQLGQVRREQAL